MEAEGCILAGCAMDEVEDMNVAKVGVVITIALLGLLQLLFSCGLVEALVAVVRSMTITSLRRFVEEG